MTNLNELTSKELKEIAKELKVKDWWLKKKSDLIADIEKIQEETKEVQNEVVEETVSNNASMVVVGTENVNDNEEKVIRAKPKRGQSIEYNGKSQNICAWAEELGINANTLYGRLYKLNWSLEKAFTPKAKK